MEGSRRSYERKIHSSESKESNELFRGSIGFDFIFTKEDNGEDKIWCIEINGHDSGIGGVGELPEGTVDKTHQYFAKMRNEKDDDVVRRIRLGNEILNDMRSGAFSVSDKSYDSIWNFVVRRMKDKPLQRLAQKNPKFLEEIASDKRLQVGAIPKELAPRTYRKGDPGISRTGYWILKPNFGRGGNKVVIMSNTDFRIQFRGSVYEDSYVAQELIESRGAELAEGELVGNPACMRLLMDFQYMSDGTVNPLFESAYQRVTAHGKRSSLENRYVVNLSRKAEAVPASEHEIKLAHEAALKVIQELAKRVPNPYSPRTNSKSPFEIHRTLEDVTLTVESDGKEKGRVLLYYGEKPFPYYYVANLIVSDSERGNGYGSELMEKVEAHIRKSGVAGLLVDAIEPKSPAYGMYRKRGWKLVPGTEDTYYFNMQEGQNPERLRSAL